MSQSEIVDSVAKKINYIPKAIGSREGLIKLCDEKNTDLRNFNGRVSNYIDGTITKAKSLSKKATQLKDTNRFFYKMTSSVPYYYPDNQKKNEQE